MPGSTHVANATPYTIWVHCNSDRWAILEVSQKIESAYAENYKKMHSHEDSGSGKIGVTGITKYIAGFEGEINGKHQESNHDERQNSNSSAEQWALKRQMLHVAESKGYTPIVSGANFPFATSGDLVFISIFIEAGEHGFQTVCSGASVHSDSSVIVRYDGQLMLQKYGADVFVDVAGTNHRTTLREHLKRLEREKKQTGAFCNNLFATLQGLANGGLRSAELAAGRRILKSWDHGTYLRAYKNENKVDMSKGAQDWEHWFVERLGAGKVALRAIHSPHRFLCAHPDGHVDLADKVNDWEKWMVAQVGEKWSFLSFHGQRLSANKDGSVRCVANPGAGDAIHFRLEDW